jgi:hypothetical protein
LLMMLMRLRMIPSLLAAAPDYEDFAEEED